MVQILLLKLLKTNIIVSVLPKLVVACVILLYSLNGLDSSHVSFAPLLAYFKAWFDTYGVQRSQNWLTTKCFAIIKYIEDNCYCDFSDTFIKSSVGSTPIDVVAPLIYDFFQFELSQTWYTIPDDFLAIHRSEPDISITPQFSTVGLDGNIVNGDTSVNLGTGTTNSFTLSTLQVLQRVSRYVNKDSIIGKKLSQWLKVHLNSDISNSLYKIAIRALDILIKQEANQRGNANTKSNIEVYQALKDWLNPSDFVNIIK